MLMYLCPYRCVSPSSSDDDFGILCKRYYGGSDGYINGSEISGILEVLQEISNNESDNTCIQLMENYFCHYYFPSCNLTTGKITPVCKSSCGLLRNNEDCSKLVEVTNMQLKHTPLHDCLQTYHMFINLSALSENCLSIEGLSMI